MMQHEYVTIREAVEICRASEKRLRDAINAGEISHVMLMDRARRQGSGSKLVKHVSVSELEKWLERCRSGKTAIPPAC